MVGIVTYGAYVPKFRIKVKEIAKIWGKNPEDISRGLNVFEKSVPDLDEDAITLAVEAARYAIKRINMNPCEIGAIYVGSESHPYAVKPTATVVAEAICTSPELTTAADFEFACKAGTAAIQTCMGLVMSKMIKYGLAIGTDTSQAAPGNALEYATGASAAAFVIGNDNLMVKIEDTYSYTTDTPDFWRREGMSYPEHGGRFTGEPAYFKHVLSATRGLFEKTGTNAKDYDYAVFHQPNGKFPKRAAKLLGFTKSQIEAGLMVKKIGNTYSASSLTGLAAILDKAKPGSRIMMTSFGSGAGSDSFSMTVTDLIEDYRDCAPSVSKLIENPKYLDYGMYVKHTRKLRM